MNNSKTITVIDGQGGSLGKALVKKIKNKYPEIEILAIGTNSIATSSMLQSGADLIATGENPVLVAARNSNLIIGPIGIIVADALHGEITPKMALAISQSTAHKLLLPISKCNLSIAGTTNIGLDALIEDIINSIDKYI
ncbi:MAG: DUF3842 family protein [Pleomorphochaeta sp.]|jgi:hypothetical protein